MRTFQTRVALDAELLSWLDEYADLFARVERALFADLQKEKASVAELKKSYLKRFSITARQFNSARVSIEGKIRSLKEIQKQRLFDLKEHLGRLNKRIAGKRAFRKHLLHQKKQKIEAKIRKIESDQKRGQVSLCFGSRKLFRAQYHLDKSGFQSHEQWLKEWREKRNSAFFLMGSKDETSGNQSCTAGLEEEGTFSIRLRLPNGFQEKYLSIKGVRFAYGQEEIALALQENKARQVLQKEGCSSYKERGAAISYRFVRDEKGWRIFVSIQDRVPHFTTNRDLGYLGLDLNVDHIALMETDRSGNPVKTTTLPLCLYGKTKAQSRALIGEAAKRIVNDAKKTGKPIALEKLDFQAKKRLLSQCSVKQARMLSAFSYQTTLSAIKARAYREGVEVFEVSPAYTSQIGKLKFAKRYGLSIHHAAALCIARRIPKFSEKLPRHSEVPNGKGAYVAFAVPARTQHRSFWSYLGEVTRKLRTALAEHLRVAKRQSIGPPASV